MFEYVLSLWKNIKCKGYRIKQHIGKVTVKVNIEKGIKLRYLYTLKKSKSRIFSVVKSFGLLYGFFAMLLVISFSCYLLDGI